MTRCTAEDSFVSYIGNNAWTVFVGAHSYGSVYVTEKHEDDYSRNIIPHQIAETVAQSVILHEVLDIEEDGGIALLEV